MSKFDAKWVDVECEGEQSGEKYFGRFLIKPLLTHKERADAIRLGELWCRGIVDNIEERLFLTTQAFLKFHIVESDAKWWSKDGTLDIYDENPVYAISAKIKELQDVVKPKKPQENQAVQETSQNS